MEIIIKDGYIFNYRTSGGDVGSISNINKPEGLKIDIDKIGNTYHVSFKLDGMYIQIWCIKYTIRKIGE